jgi:hypothetical protein
LTRLSIPPNCRFEIEDAEDEWRFSYPFDYIHGRALATYFKDHVPVFQSAFNASRSGVYFEMQDVAIPFRRIDDSMKGTAFERWLGLVKEAAMLSAEILDKSQITSGISRKSALWISLRSS